MSWTNFHSHSHFCDGKESPEAQVLQALAYGFPAFGFSSHGPLPFSNSWSVKPDQLDAYLQEIRQLQAKYQGQIQLYLGMEIDYVPNLISPIDSTFDSLDYCLGSIHFIDAFEDGTPWEIDGRHERFLEGLRDIYQGDIEAVVRRYFELTREMIQVACPDVIGHLDKMKIQNEGGDLFSESAPWYREAVFQTLEEIRGAGVIVEVNTRGLYKKVSDTPYPSPWILAEMQKMGIPIMLNSDSHRPQELQSCFDATAAQLLEIGFQELMIFFDHTWQPVPFTSQGIQVPKHE